MPSPFPGMNPFVEQDDIWHDFRERFIPVVAEWVGSQVRPSYIVKIDEQIYVHEIPQEARRLVGRGDVTVGLTGDRGTPRSAAGVLEAPVQVQLPVVDVAPLSFVEIRDRRSRELVTVIELLSPSNKRPGPDREQYIAKRSRLLSGPVHLVEIDLLRAGAPMPSQERPACMYSVMVSRLEDRPKAGFWPIGLRSRLPEVPVPLRRPDGDARLDLQHALDRIYDAAGYEDYIYEGSIDPPLDPDDAAWAAALVRESR